MRVLIAEDDDVARLELQALLARVGYEVEVVSDGAKAWEVLQRPDAPRLVVLDWLMEGMDGVEVCRRMRQSSARRDVYVIVLTSRGDEEHVIAGLQAGANDYVTKPFNRNELLARLRVGERMLGLHDELASRALELAAIATIDDLTGIANRRAFDARLEAECLRASRSGSPLSLLILDLDHFKSLNDLHGHPAGDEALKRMGRLLSSVSRKTDLVARYGGEEFAVILVDTDMTLAKEIAERFRARIEAEPWPDRPITASIGIASCGGVQVGAAELIGRADGALYFAKQQGRNRAAHSVELDHVAGSEAATTALNPSGPGLTAPKTQTKDFTSRL